MKISSVLFALVVLGLSSCERHEWHTDGEKGKDPKSTDTINLFLHGDSHGGEHGKSEDGHGKTEEGGH